MPLIYIVPFQTMPKFDLTTNSSSISLSFMALNYSYIIDVPIVEYEAGTLNTDVLLISTAYPTYNGGQFVSMPIVTDTTISDSVMLSAVQPVYSSVSIPTTMPAPGDVALTDSVMLSVARPVVTKDPTILAFPLGDTTLSDDIVQAATLPSPIKDTTFAAYALGDVALTDAVILAANPEIQPSLSGYA